MINLTRYKLHILLVTSMLVLLTSACVPPRQRYFSQMHNRRMDSFRRWKQQKQREDRQKPTLEGPLDLEETIHLTLAYNTQIDAMLQERRKADGRVMSAYSEALPKVDASANYTRLDRIQTVDLGTESFPIGSKDNYSYRVEITQPLFKGGSMVIAQRAARIFSFLSDEKVRREVEQSLFQAANAYFDAQLAKRLIEVQEAALQSAKENLEDVKSRHKHGTATEYDMLRSRVDVSNVKADLIEQRNTRDQAMTRLMRVMGASQRSEVELTTEMTYEPVSPDFVKSVKKAFAHRPDIYQAELNLALQNEKLREAFTSYWPDVNAYFWKEWAKPNPHDSTDINWDSQYQGGLQLNWAIFDGLAREGRIIQDAAELRQNRILLFDAEERAIQEVQNAILELQNAAELVESQKLNIQRADRALELVQAGYKEGVNTEVEVLDARAALTQARGLYYQALHRHITARVNLQKAEGILGPPPGNAAQPDKAVNPRATTQAIIGRQSADDTSNQQGKNTGE